MGQSVSLANGGRGDGRPASSGPGNQSTQLSDPSPLDHPYNVDTSHSTRRRLRRRTRLDTSLTLHQTSPLASSDEITTNGQNITPFQAYRSPDSPTIALETSPAQGAISVTDSSDPVPNTDRPLSSNRSSYLARVGARILPRYSTSEAPGSTDDARSDGRAVRRRLADGISNSISRSMRRSSIHSSSGVPPTTIRETARHSMGFSGANAANTTSMPNLLNSDSQGPSSTIRSRLRLSSVRDSLLISRPTTIADRDNSIRQASSSDETTQAQVDEQTSLLPSPPTPAPSSRSPMTLGMPPLSRQLRRPVPRDERNLRREEPRFRRLPTSFRGGSSRPRHGEDQAAMLSRLLSHAAALTAVSLVGNNQHALLDAQDVGGDGVDGSFQNFLQTLENGRLAAALRNGSNTSDSSSGGNEQTVNFFRMFRFGATNPQLRRNAASTTRAGRPRSQPEATTSPSGGTAADQEDGLMVPVIIVGIRSMTSEEGAEREGGVAAPPFFDMLQHLATEEEPPNRGSSFLRRTDGSSRFGRMRRSSFNNNPLLGHDLHRNNSNQPTLGRTSAESTLETINSLTSEPSILSDSPPGPHPPPSTPADLNLSALSSGTTTPTNPASASSSQRPSTSLPSADNVLRRSLLNADAGVNNESGDSVPRGIRRRRMSDSEFGQSGNLGSGSSRRNGIVGDSNPMSDSMRADGTSSRRGNHNDSTNRSWIIYVLGGSYPEDHPILTTPSLFTDSPSYEDMLLLATLLGPGKPPVASDEDVASASGLYRIGSDSSILVASAVGHDGEQLHIDNQERCLVCLCEYATEDELRKLRECGHFFHRECIDQWLTTGRNSCPLCRGQGVDEKKTEAEDESASNSNEAGQTVETESS